MIIIARKLSIDIVFQ